MSSQLDRIKQAAHKLLVEIDLNTDCMSNQIKRERIDHQIEVLEHVLGEGIGKPEPMPFHVQELRPEVLAIALLMEARMREKDAALGESFKTKTHAQLGIPALAKCMQLSISIGNPEEVKKHAVDVANYMMMIAFVEGVLPTDEDGGPGWAGVDQVNTEPLGIPAFLRLDRIDPHN